MRQVLGTFQRTTPRFMLTNEPRMEHPSFGTDTCTTQVPILVHATLTIICDALPVCSGHMSTFLVCGSTVGIGAPRCCLSKFVSNMRIIAIRRKQAVSGVLRGDGTREGGVVPPVPQRHNGWDEARAVAICSANRGGGLQIGMQPLFYKAFTSLLPTFCSLVAVSSRGTI